MHTLLWIVTALGALAGALLLFTGLQGAESAPQEAAIAAIAVACAVIPYCLARAVSELSRPS